MSLNWGTYFQRGMSLKRSDWVDHSGHGDENEGDATLFAGAITGFSGRNGGGAVFARRGRGRALRAPRGGARALWLPAAGAQAQGSGAALLGAHDGLFAPAGEAGTLPRSNPSNRRRGSPHIARISVGVHAGGRFRATSS